MSLNRRLFRFGPVPLHVPHDLAGGDVDDLFGDVGAMVADALKLVGDDVGREGEFDVGVTGCDALLHFQKDGPLKFVHRVIAGENGLREFRVLPFKARDRIAHDADRAIGHHPKSSGRLIGERLKRRDLFGDGHGAVGRALQFVVDLHDHEQEAEEPFGQIDCCARDVGQQIDGRSFDLHVSAIDDRIMADDPVRFGLIHLKDGFDGAFDHAFHTSPLLDHVGPQPGDPSFKDFQRVWHD